MGFFGERCPPRYGAKALVKHNIALFNALTPFILPILNWALKKRYEKDSGKDLTNKLAEFEGMNTLHGNVLYA